MLRHRTPNSKEIQPGFQSTKLERNISLQCSIQKAKTSLLWGFLNVCLLTVIVYDLTYKCPLYTTAFNYIEYALVIISGLNIIYHIIRYFTLIVKVESLQSNSQSDTQITQTVLRDFDKLPENYLHNRSLNLSGQSWRTVSSDDSYNYSLSSPSWIYKRGSPKPIMNNPHITNMVLDDASDYIADEKMLKQYLYDYEAFEKVSNTNNSVEPTTNLLSNFWNNSSPHIHHDSGGFIKKQPYLVSPTTTSADLANVARNKDEISPLNVTHKGNEIWRKRQIEPNVLTQWNANLRMWISQTILERLVSEIDFVNQHLQNHYLNDVQIGLVGLERLRKTAQTELSLQFTPTLTTVIPFLEVSTNQEYLIFRLKNLIKGGCMSEFKWNSGGKYNGKEWDDSLPTDSAIIMHLISTYLDSQLLPLPHQPDAKPFSKEHYIKMGEKTPNNPLTLAINQVSDKPPHYRVVVGEDVYETVKGHNNLFHTIILFLYFVSKKEHGMLGKVNMGKSGVNMLWIIDS